MEKFLSFHNDSQKPFWQSSKSCKTVLSYCGGAKFFQTDREVLECAVRSVSIEGLWIELGVATGKTINFVAHLAPDQTIYGFDSFEGLPESWIREDREFSKGAYAQKELPTVASNVKLIQGLFKDSLPSFASSHPQPIAFLHVDCDLYSSTKEAFDILKNQLTTNTVIVFDEFYNYPGYEQHEIKAFEEFLSQTNLSHKPLAFNALHEQLALSLRGSAP